MPKKFSGDDSLSTIILNFLFILLSTGAIYIFFTNIAFVGAEADLTIGANYPRSVTPPNSFTVNVYASNAITAKDAAANFVVKIYSSSPQYISIVGPSEISFAGKIIPNDDKSYTCGDFTFQVASNTPPGPYSIVVSINYKYGALYLGTGSETLSLPLEIQSQISSASYWIQMIQSVLPYILLIVLIGAMFRLFISTKKHEQTTTQTIP
jgi:hypothetical protein